MTEQKKLRHRRWLPGAGLLVSALLASVPVSAAPPGRIDNCADIPRGAIPSPNGFFVRRWQQEQVARALEDHFVIYRHEWYMGGNLLGAYGHFHIHQIAQKLAEVPFSVVLQPETDAAVNETRRRILVDYFLACGITDAEARVVIGFPQAEGLYGQEGILIYDQGYQRAGGATGSGAGSSFGSARGSTTGSLSGGFRGY